MDLKIRCHCCNSEILAKENLGQLLNTRATLVSQIIEVRERADRLEGMRSVMFRLSKVELEEQKRKCLKRIEVLKEEHRIIVSLLKESKVPGWDPESLAISSLLKNIESL